MEQFMPHNVLICCITDFQWGLKMTTRCTHCNACMAMYYGSNFLEQRWGGYLGLEERDRERETETGGQGQVNSEKSLRYTVMSYLLLLGVNRRILLNRILNRWDVGTLNYNDSGQNQELSSCEHEKCSSEVNKSGKISWLTEQLPVFEDSYLMEVVMLNNGS